MDSVNNHGGSAPHSFDNGNNNVASKSDSELFDQIYQNHPELDNNKDGKIDASELSDALNHEKISLTELLSMIGNSLSSQGAEAGSGQGGGGQGGGGQGGGGQGGGGQGGGGQGGGGQGQPSNAAPSDSGQPSARPIDENGDGKIDASEFMKAADKNQDGKLNAQELAAGLQAMGIGGGAKPQ